MSLAADFAGYQYRWLRPGLSPGHRDRAIVIEGTMTRIPAAAFGAGIGQSRPGCIASR
jgi:hypothetical protein